MNDEQRPSMPTIAGQYQTVHTIVTLAGVTLQHALNSNPRRWYVQFSHVTGGTPNWQAVPSPVPPIFALTTNVGEQQRYTFTDAPSLVIGDWYLQGQAGTVILCTECVYLGDG
jgi:hypothetical protein